MTKQHYEVGTYNPVRNTKGQFSTSKIKSFFYGAFKVFFTLGIGGLLGYAMYHAGAESTPVSPDTLAVKIADYKNQIVNDIISCESQGKDGLLTFDSNKKASLGIAQFQTLTIQHYSKKLYGQTISQKEAILIAYDNDKARQLAYDIIFNEKDGWKNWYNCGVKNHISARLALLASIQN